MLVRHFDRSSSTRCTGLAVVAGLHGVVLSIALAIDVERAPATAPRAVEVRLLDAPSRREAQPAPPPIAAVLRPAAPIDLPPLPDIAIQAPAAIAPAIGTPAEPSPPVAEAASALAATDEVAPAQPRFVQRVQYERFDPPAYPALSRRLGEHGVVVIRVLIDEAGRPVEAAVSVSSGFHRLDAAALGAVRAARFRPHVEDGRARAVVALVPIRFELS